MGWLSKLKLIADEREPIRMQKLHTAAVSAKENLKSLKQADADEKTIQKYKQLKHKHSLLGRIESGLKTTAKLHRKTSRTRKTKHRKPKSNLTLY